jgi:hypothetical protein
MLLNKSDAAAQMRRIYLYYRRAKACIGLAVCAKVAVQQCKRSGYEDRGHTAPVEMRAFNDDLASHGCEGPEGCQRRAGNKKDRWSRRGFPQLWLKGWVGQRVRGADAVCITYIV